MVRFYDPVDRKDQARIERKLAAAGIEYTVTPTLRGNRLPSTIGIAEEDLLRAAELLGDTPAQTRH